MSDETFKSSIAYITGYIAAKLEGLANSYELPARQLTTSVATLLLSQTHGPVLGAEHHMPSLRGKATKGSTAPCKVALASSSHSKTPMTLQCPECSMKGAQGLHRHLVKKHGYTKKAASKFFELNRRNKG